MYEKNHKSVANSVHKVKYIFTIKTHQLTSTSYIKTSYNLIIKGICHLEFLNEAHLVIFVQIQGTVPIVFLLI